MILALPVVSGATVQCTMGTTTGQLKASQSGVTLGGAPAVLISDCVPLVNVGACGMCTSLLNPTVASATAAALGVLTPMPCVPSPLGMWTCPGTPMLAGQPGVSSDATLTCAYGGTLRIITPGQGTVRY